MSASESALLKKIRQLPPSQQAEVEDFVDFLTNKTLRRAAFDRLLAIAPRLEAAGVAPPGEGEIVSLVKEVRAERRAQRERGRTNRP